MLDSYFGRSRDERAVGHSASVADPRHFRVYPANGLAMLRRMSGPAADPNAPVALVTMEIRHPATDSLTESSSKELKHLLFEHLPIERQGQDMAWAMGAGGSPTPTPERFVRYVNRDNTLAASMKAQALVIETTAYTGFESLVDVMMRVVDAFSWPRIERKPACYTNSLVRD